MKSVVKIFLIGFSQYQICLNTLWIWAINSLKTTLAQLCYCMKIETFLPPSILEANNNNIGSGDKLTKFKSGY